jgi:hypothetical protein
MNTLLPAPEPIAAQYVWTILNCGFLMLVFWRCLSPLTQPPPPLLLLPPPQPLRNGPLDSASCRGPKTEQEPCKKKVY